jgi:hypothetical protein
MFPRVRAVRHVKDDRLELKFSDNTASELDFRHRIVGRGGWVRFLLTLAFDPR